MDNVSGNIYEVTTKTSSLFVAPLFSLFFMAMFIPFATSIGTVFGSIYGIYGGTVFAFWDTITGKPGLSFLWILPVSLVFCLVFSILFSLLPTKGKRFKVQFVWCIVLTLPMIISYLFLRV